MDSQNSIENQQKILEEFYRSTNGDKWKNNTNWLSEKPLNEWYGVTTDDDGNVVRLKLPFNKLTGPIPESLGNLQKLEELNLYSNQLTGPIPESLGKLQTLERLYLDSNQLTGPIPESLGNLQSLRVKRRRKHSENGNAC